MGFEKAPEAENIPLDCERPSREELEQRLKEALAEIDAVKKDAAASAGVKAEFLSRMSHEMRTPLNAVIGLANLCLGTGLSPKQSDYLDKIRSSAFALLSVVDDVIDFSRISEEGVKLANAPFHLQEVMAGLDERFSRDAARKGLELILSIAEDAPISLIGDRLRLEQLLAHLTSNAVKFTECGSISVSASLLNKDKGRATIRFSVADTGIGMEEKDIPAFLESFTQAESYNTRTRGGAGLGLAICRRLAALMGAEIEIESSPGRGSVFSFAVTFMRHLKESDYVGDMPEQFRNLRALVVDDEDVPRNLIMRYLKAFTFEPTGVESGKAALSALQDDSSPFGLILLDWLMPGMDGLAFLRAIGERIPPERRPPVIMVSSYSREDLAHQAEILGAAAFLLKPVNRSILFETVIEVLEKADIGKEAAQCVCVGPERASSLSGTSILLVEDNSINRQVAAEMLESWGAETAIAVNGLEALEAVRNKRFDAVLMDVQMPVMDGLEAARAIRSDPAAADLPIIALTAHALAEDREKCLEAGMNDYLTKPIEPEKLLFALAQWIETVRLSPFPEASAVSQPVAAPVATPGRQSGLLDIEAALKRLSGNKDLLRRILAEFRESYAYAGRDILALTQSGQLTEARRLAHTIKGVAGNLSAKRLFEEACMLESALREEDADRALSLCPGFDETLVKTLEAMGEQLASGEDGATQTCNAIPSPRILLVDDARLNRKIFSDLLETKGYNVTTAENGMAACAVMFNENVGKAAFDMILMDLEMPLMDGYKAAKTIRGLLKSSAKPPCREDIPIIALTAHDVSKAAPRCLESGMDDCVHKEFNGVDLLAAVEKAFLERLEPLRQERKSSRESCVLDEHDASAILCLIEELEKQLGEASLEAEKSLERLSHLAGGRWPRELDAMKRELGHFNFKGALTELAFFKDRLGGRAGGGKHGSG
jgi:CheY-like chemotaxis protein/nitrogen-specific signal transduction histidine kinase